MAKKKEVCSTNGSCSTKSCCCMKWAGWVMLVVGILYLLSDLGIFTWFGATFSWFTIVFLVVGLKMVCGNICK